MTRTTTPNGNPHTIEDRHMNPNLRKTAIAAAAAATCCMLAFPAQAFEAEKGGVRAHIDTKLSMGVAWRADTRDADLVGISNGGNAYSTNGDDGNLAYDSGDVVSSAAKITSDLTLTYKDYGVFVRGSFFFNERLNDYEVFNEDNYGRPGKEASLAEYQYKTERIQDYLGKDADLLDAYFFGSNQIGSRTLTYKIGRQVLNWGESTLVQNGLNSIVSADANQLRVPGYEIEEAIVPVGMVFASINLIDNVSAEGFYQMDWERTQPDAAGSYWGTNDFAGVAGTRANLSFGIPGENDIGSTTPRGPDNDPASGGQYGGALRFFIPQLHDLDFAIYGAKYHSRLPLISGVSANEPLRPFGSSYFIEYPEDIEMYGFSFNTTMPWDLAVQAEYSYKIGQPLQLDDVELLLTGLGIPSQLNPVLGGASGNQYIRGWRRHDVSQIDIAFTRVFGPAHWLRNDQTIMVLEIGYDHVHSLPPESELRYEAPGTYLPGYDETDGPTRAGFLVNRGKINPADPDGRDNLPANDKNYATADSWGYKILARLQYNNAIGAVNLEPTLRFDHDVSGYTPTPIGNFVEGRKLLSTSLGWNYLGAWSGDIGYVVYFGGGTQNLLSDRDYVEASVKYAF